MTVVVSDFRLRFPEFSATPDGSIVIALDDAASGVGAWGAETDRAVMFLAAHYLSLDGQGENASAASQEVATVKVGDVQTTFKGGNSPVATHDWSGTLYGRRYFEIRKRWSIGVLVV